MKSTFNVAELLKKGRSGDRSAFKQIYEEYVLEMLSASHKITNSLEDAEDIFQESFLKSLEKLDTLQNWNSYKAWLKRIVINASLQKIRSRTRWEPLDETDIGDETDDSWYVGLSFDQINEGIHQLPNGCRQIFTLYLLEDYKHREIADLLGISVSTSKSQYRYAIHLMKTMLTKKYLP